jgi:hypothetical protein
MNSEEFEAIFEGVVGACRQVLVKKASEYATDEDRLHNFKVAAALNNELPTQACWGFATKHIVSIADMVKTGIIYPDATWEEKIGDALNYLILLRALVEEQ